jgi:hypothetical protein
VAGWRSARQEHFQERTIPHCQESGCSALEALAVTGVVFRDVMPAHAGDGSRLCVATSLDAFDVANDHAMHGSLCARSEVGSLAVCRDAVVQDLADFLCAHVLVLHQRKEQGFADRKRGKACCVHVEMVTHVSIIT